MASIFTDPRFAPYLTATPMSGRIAPHVPLFSPYVRPEPDPVVESIEEVVAPPPAVVVVREDDGTFGDDNLFGQGNYTLTGGADSDLFTTTPAINPQGEKFTTSMGEEVGMNPLDSDLTVGWQGGKVWEQSGEPTAAERSASQGFVGAGPTMGSSNPAAVDLANDGIGAAYMTGPYGLGPESYPGMAVTKSVTDHALDALNIGLPTAVQGKSIPEAIASNIANPWFLKLAMSADEAMGLPTSLTPDMRAQRGEINRYRVSRGLSPVSEMGFMGNTAVRITDAMFDQDNLAKGGPYGFGFGFKDDGSFGGLSAFDGVGPYAEASAAEQDAMDAAAEATGFESYTDSDGNTVSSGQQAQDEVAANPDEYDASVGGTGDGGDSKVICGELNRQGIMPDDIYEGDLEYQRTNVHEFTKSGYLLWARPLVKLMRRSQIVTKIVTPVAMAWGKEMAKRSSNIGAGSKLGAAMLYTVAPICTALGAILWMGHTSGVCSKAG